MSDLHLEFDDHPDDFHGALRATGNYDADVLVLAGDITIKSRTRWIDLISLRYKHIIYCMGNHEYYGGRIDKVERETRENLAHLKNVHILQNESVTLEGVTFHGMTLWTNFNKGNPVTMSVVEGAMNDYRIITYKDPNGSYHKFRSNDAYREHMLAVLYLKDNVKEGDVVVTHMAPSFLSIHDQYKDDHDMNCGYASDLSDIMLDYCPTLWIHGHVHNSFDYMIGDTRVLCNPRGYTPNDLNPDFDINATVEIN